METKTKFSPWQLILLTALFLLSGFITSCSKDGDAPEPDLKPGDEVTTFQKAMRYDQTRQFQSDLDAFCTYAINLQALRYAYWNMVSFDFADASKAFTATPEQMMENTKQVELFYNIVNHLVANEDVYSEAMENLDAAGIIPLQQGTVTRGFPLADALAFKKACQNTQYLGRKSVMIAMERGGFLRNANKLDELFRSIPEGNRRGYTNAQTFWSDFSQGKLDERSNVIFNYLYKNEYAQFGYICDDIGITPQTNMAIASQRLIETGSSLVLDALPFADAINKGKDLFNTVEATLQVNLNLLKWSEENGYEGFNTDALKNFIQVWANNALNYGRDLKKYTDRLNGKDINYSELYDGLYDLGKDIAVYNTNEYLFGNVLTDYLDKLDASQLEAQEKIVYDKNGNPLAMVVMVDKRTGMTKLSFYIDDDGHLLIRPNEPGEKVITVVDKNTGKRTTKTVVVEEYDHEPIEVEFDEVLLDEDPKDGYIEVKPATMGVFSNGSSYKAMIVTNYLYYTCTTNDDWLSCSIGKDVNYLYFTTATNDTGQERRGHITVSATDSKGKVLKSTVFTVVQQIPEKTEYWVTASPSTLQFDAKGGKLESVIDHSFAFNHLDLDWSDELSGWVTIDWKETATGWNIVVDASENKAAQERSGSITVYAGYSQEAIQNAKNGNIDPDLVTSTTILVKQSAKEDQAGFNPRTDIRSISVIGSVYTSGGNFVNPDHYEIIRLDLKAGDIEVSKTEKSLMVTGSGKGTYVENIDGNTISMTVKFNSDGFEEITDLKVTGKGHTILGPLEWSINATNIPFENHYTYSSTSESYTWDGIEENGLNISSYSQTHVTSDESGNKKTYTLSKKSDIRNKLHISISYP